MGYLPANSYYSLLNQHLGQAGDGICCCGVPHSFALILCHARGAGISSIAKQGISGLSGYIFCHFYPQQKVWQIPVRVVGPGCVKGGSDLAGCVVAAL